MFKDFKTMTFEHVSGLSLNYDENTLEITSKIFKL